MTDLMDAMDDIDARHTCGPKQWIGRMSADSDGGGHASVYVCDLCRDAKGRVIEEHVGAAPVFTEMSFR